MVSQDLGILLVTLFDMSSALQDWRVYLSSKGKPYWFHKTTNKTQWDPPPPKQTQNQTHTQRVPQATFGRSSKSSAPARIAEAEMGESINQSVAGAVIGKPEQVASARPGSVSVASGVHGARPKRAIDAEGLPEGWRKYVSSTTGKPYYHHKTSKTTSWVLPTE